MTDRPAGKIQMPDAPRAVPKWFFLRRMQAMFFGGVLMTALHLPLGAGLVLWMCALGGWASPVADLQLDRSRASATAVITDKQFLGHMHMGSEHPWRVAFRFTPPDGAGTEAVGYIYDRSYLAKAVGDEIKVQYDPANPGRARPEGGAVSAIPLWVYALILAVTVPEFLVGVGLLILVARRARVERVLLAHGVGTEADVVRVDRVSYLHFGRQNPFDVVYRFRDHHGAEVAGRDRTYHYAWAKALKPQDTVAVVYNPNDPRANALWLHGRDTRSAPGCPETMVDTRR